MMRDPIVILLPLSRLAGLFDSANLDRAAKLYRIVASVCWGPEVVG